MLLFAGFAHAELNPDGSKTAPNAFFALICLANFFQNFGPNTTTFVIPGEAFPTRYRSTAHGISAASGKLGSIITQVVFSVLQIRHDRTQPPGITDPSSSIHILYVLYHAFACYGWLMFGIKASNICLFHAFWCCLDASFARDYAEESRRAFRFSCTDPTKRPWFRSSQ